MTRRQFMFLTSALAVGCGRDRTDPPIDAEDQVPIPPLDAGADGPFDDAGTDAAPVCASTSASVGTNHGHVAVVPAGDVDAGTERTYQIQGTSTHPHTITVTAAMFAMLRTGSSVSVTSTNDAGHIHVVTISCA